MNTVKNRNFKEPLTWGGNLNDDCKAEWAGLMLHAECSKEDYWEWCVYDILDNEKKIDCSKNHDEKIISGEIARNKAEEIARGYIKNKLISEYKIAVENIDTELIISNFKILGISPVNTILTLIQDFGFEYNDAKNQVFDSPSWKGLREQSETLTQEFMDIGAENADNVEINDGRVTSVTFDLTKDNNKKQTLWEKLKSRFK